MSKYYARIFTGTGFADRIVDSVDLSSFKIPSSVYRIEFRPMPSQKFFNGIAEAMPPKLNFYIGEVVTRQDAIMGKVERNSFAYNSLIHCGEKQMLKARDGELYLIEKNGTILSPELFDENGFFIGDPSKVL